MNMNNINDNEQKLFYDLYLDGSKDSYYLTYKEIISTFGEELGNIVWEKGSVPDEWL